MENLRTQRLGNLTFLWLRLDHMQPGSDVSYSIFRSDYLGTERFRHSANIEGVCFICWRNGLINVDAIGDC